MLGQRRASSSGKHVLVSCWDSQDEPVNQDAPHHRSFTQMSDMEMHTTHIPQFSARANCIQAIWKHEALKSKLHLLIRSIIGSFYT